MLQHLVVALIVLGASLYAGWTLLPAALRRPLARKLLPWPPTPPGCARPPAAGLRLAMAAAAAAAAIRPSPSR
jgi:hypothetical protein